jgi:hypothetical protein
MSTMYKARRFARSPIQASLIVMLTVGMIPATSFAAPQFAVEASANTLLLPSGIGSPATSAGSAGSGAGDGNASASAFSNTATNQLAVSGDSIWPGATSSARAGLRYGTYTNSSATTTRVRFAYRIEAGSLGFSPSNSGGYAEVSNGASLDSGVSIYGSLRLLSDGLNVTVAAQTDDFANLNGFLLTSTGASWNETNYNRLLNDVAPGGTLDFSYFMSGGAGISASGFCCDGTPCSAAFRVGDPNSFSNTVFLGMGLTFEALTGNNTVPLPATLALTAMGLAGIGAARRKRRQA